MAELRRLGFRILAYVDDFGGAPPSAPDKAATKEDALAGGDVVRNLLASLWLSLHPRKGVWKGPTALPLLGHVVDTARGLFILKPERAAKIMSAAAGLLGRAAHHRRWVKARSLRRFFGLDVSSSLSVTSARFHLRSLYSTLGGAQTVCVRLSHQDLRDLGWWAAQKTQAGRGRALWAPAPTLTMHTDASLSGWGAVLDNVMPAGGFHAPAYRGAHINLLELVTDRLGLQSFRRLLTRQDSWLLLKSDSTVAVGAVNAMASRSPVIMEELRRIHALCLTWGVIFRAEHLPNAVNAYADRLSREGDSTNWTLSVAAFRELENRFGPHSVDWFALANTARCGRVYGKDWSLGCKGVDELKRDWRGENGWASPPFNLMPAVVNKAIRSGCALTLVAPRWRAQPWYWRAAEACTSHWQLPEAVSSLRHGTSTRAAPKPSWGADLFRFSGAQLGSAPPYALTA